MTTLKLFREYLTSKKLSAEFENFSPEDLDARLASFYVETKMGNCIKKQQWLRTEVDFKGI